MMIMMMMIIIIIIIIFYNMCIISKEKSTIPECKAVHHIRIIQDLQNKSYLFQRLRLTQ